MTLSRSAQLLMHLTTRLVIVSLVVVPLLVRSDTQQSNSVELIFSDPRSYTSPADRCEADVCTSLLRLIESARSSIDFAIYGARDQTAILEALLAAKARGVTIRGIVDRDPDGKNYYSSTEEWVTRLGAVGSDRAREGPSDFKDNYSPTCTRPPGFSGPLQCLAYDLGSHWLTAEHASREDLSDPEEGGPNRLMHNKFFVVDGLHVWTGSTNVSDSGTGGYNANVVLVATSRALARQYSNEFELMAKRHSPGAKKPQRPYGVEEMTIGDTALTLWFSPQDQAMTYGVRGLIARAKTSVDVAVFYLTSKWITADLIDAHKRGVRVRVIVDATSAQNGYSKHELLREVGIPTKIENWGGKMHMKSAVIDNEYLVIGSMNWTSAGEYINDENTLLLKSKRLANQFSQFYEQIWLDIPEQWQALDSRPDPESKDSGTSCHDGADNDFDDLVDDKDPGCSAKPLKMLELPPHRLEKKSSAKQRVSRQHRLYQGLQCDDSYTQWFVCLPKMPRGRDVDCPRIPFRGVMVQGRDPHRLDLDGNGRGCERPLE